MFFNPSTSSSLVKKVSEGENKPRKFDIYFNRFRDDRVLPIIEKTYTKKTTITYNLYVASLSHSYQLAGLTLVFDTPESDILLANFSFSPGTSEELEEMVNEIGRALYSVEEKLTGRKEVSSTTALVTLESVTQEKGPFLVTYQAGTLDHSWLNLFQAM